MPTDRPTMPKLPNHIPFRLLPILAACLVPSLALALDLRHDMAIRLSPDQHLLEGVDRLTADGAGTLDLRLSPRMEVTSVSVDGRPHPGRPENGRLAIPLDEGRSHSIDVHYRGALPPDGGPMVDPDGTFLPGDAGWFPIAPADSVRYRVTVTVPEGQKAVATGTLIQEETSPDGYRATFETTHPEPPSLFAGPYRIDDRREGGVRLRTYLHESVAPLAQGLLTRSARMIEHFSERIGPYPFGSFDIVSAPLPVGLGFPGLTYIDRRILPLPFILERSLPHEVAHNWWGNGIEVDAASGNWAEGLTTFMADYGLADKDAQHRMRLDWLRDYAALPQESDRPLRRFTAKAHDADQIVGYGKAAFVFHMLRQEIGGEAFEAGLRRFWQQHRLGTAGWEDLKHAFEESSGRRLDVFFTQWLDRVGAPRLLPPRLLPQGHADGRSVSLTLRQEAPAYALSVPVAIETAAGTERHTVRLDEEERTVRLPTAAEPRAVEIDPDHDLFRHLLPGEQPPILRDVLLANPVSVVVAADGAAADAAWRLAERLLGGAIRRSGTLPPDQPALFIGTRDAWTRNPDAATVPPELAGRGTAQVWAEKPANAPPRLWIAAEDADALRALLRPLPHYGRAGWLIFDGSRSIDQGLWPSTNRPLRILLQ